MMGAVSGLAGPDPHSADAEKRREEEMESLLRASAAAEPPPELPTAPSSLAEKARVLLREANVIEAPVVAYYLQVYALELLTLESSFTSSLPLAMLLCYAMLCYAMLSFLFAPFLHCLQCSGSRPSRAASAMLRRSACSSAPSRPVR